MDLSTSTLTLPRSAISTPKSICRFSCASTNAPPRSAILILCITSHASTHAPLRSAIPHQLGQHPVCHASTHALLRSAMTAMV